MKHTDITLGLRELNGFSDETRAGYAKTHSQMESGMSLGVSATAMSLTVRLEGCV